MVYAEKPVTQIEEIKEAVKNGAKNAKTAPIRYLKSLFPIHSWLPRYNLTWFWGDFVAGVTVGLVAIPQSISYSSKLAGLPPQFGLYTSFIGALLYALFATSKDVTIGPTAVLSLVVGQTIAQYNPGGTQADNVLFALTLAFWTGIFQLIMGLFRFGIIIDFVPIPVIAGFTTGAGIQAIINQLPGLFGIKGVNTNNAPYQVLGDFFKNLNGTSEYDVIFGLTSVVFILLLKYGTAYGAKRFPWLKYVGHLRNTIVLAIYIGISYALRFQTKTIPFSIVKDIPYGFSGVQQPSFKLSDAQRVLPAVPGVFLVSVLEHIAVAKTYGRVNGYTVDANQEIVAIGTSNAFGSLVGGFASTGSFSRSAIKSASGVRSPFASFIVGIVVIIALFSLTNVLYWIPSATLSAIVVTAISELVAKFDVVFVLAQVELLDFVGFLVAFIVTFFSTLENAIFAGVGYSVLILLLRVARPRVQVLNKAPSGAWVDEESESFRRELEASGSSKAPNAAPDGVFVFKVDESLTYPNSGYFLDSLKDAIIARYSYTNAGKTSNGDRQWSDDTEARVRERERQGLDALPALRAVVFDFSAVNQIDFTGLQALLDAKDDLRRYTGVTVPFHFANVRRRQLNTLIRVVEDGVSGASVDATPGAPGANQDEVKGLKKVFGQFTGRKSKESLLQKEQRQAAALEFFHYSVDEAVAAADRGSAVQDPEVKIVSA